MKKKLNIKALMVFLPLIVGSCLLHTFVGVNVTNSVNFTFFTHLKTSETDNLTYGNYIIFTPPTNQLFGDGMIRFIKKVACMEGDTLQVIDYKYYCNGAFVSEISIFNRPSGEVLYSFYYNGIIPNGKLFVTGDSVDSYDSRYWGFVDRQKVLRHVKPIRFSGAAHASDYVEQKKKGFYYYEEPVKKPSDNKSKQPKLDEEKYKDFIKPIINWEKVSTMHPNEFSDLFKEVEAYAMSYRTLDNFKDYAKMRTVLITRSMEFMNVGTLWAQLNPEDTTESWFPTSTYGHDAYLTETAEIKSKYISKEKENFGLLYFYSLNCSYCKKQTPLVEYFKGETGWLVKYIDIDKMPEVAARFNVKTVPTLVLVQRSTEKSLLLSSGIMTYEEIYDRLYRTLKYLNGETNETDFSNPINPKNIVKASK